MHILFIFIYLLAALWGFTRVGSDPRGLRRQDIRYNWKSSLQTDLEQIEMGARGERHAWLQAALTAARSCATRRPRSAGGR